MSTSITTCLWALAFTFTSSLGQAEQPPLTFGRVVSLELEARLARKPSIYLKLDLARQVLEIKARGIVLDKVPVKACQGATRQAFHVRTQPMQLRLPVVWEVVTGPGDTDREVIAPTTLRPARRGDEEEEEPSPVPRGTPTPTPTPRPETPSRYRVELAGNLLLWVTDRLPAAGLWHRFLQAVREGWASVVRGEQPPKDPPGFVLLVETEDARRLHHLFRQGMQLLVVAEGS